LWRHFRRMIKKLKPLGESMITRGFDPPPIMFWPCAAVFLWAQGVDWSELIVHISADEGDLSMLILRTADHLRQLRSLGDEMPHLASTSDQALHLLVRPPLL